MRANQKTMMLSMARACMTVTDLSKAANLGMNATLKTLSGKDVRPDTLGKIARALGLDVTELLEE